MIAFLLVYGDKPVSVSEIKIKIKSMIPEIFFAVAPKISDTLPLIQPREDRFCRFCPYIEEVAPKNSPRLHLCYARAYFCLCPGRYPIEPLVEKLKQTFEDEALFEAHYQEPDEEGCN